LFLQCDRTMSNMLQVDVEMATAFEDKNTCLPISENGLSEAENYQMPYYLTHPAYSSISANYFHYLKTIMTPEEFADTMNLKTESMLREFVTQENTMRIDSHQQQDVIQQQTFPMDHSIIKNRTMNHIPRTDLACPPRLIRSHIPPPIDTVNIMVPIPIAVAGPIMDDPCKKLRSMELPSDPDMDAPCKKLRSMEPPYDLYMDASCKKLRSMELLYDLYMDAPFKRVRSMEPPSDPDMDAPCKKLKHMD
jgi:hypothetical protein